MKQSRVDLGISARNHVAAHESQGCGSLAAKGPSDRKSGAKEGGYEIWDSLDKKGQGYGGCRAKDEFRNTEARI